MWILLRAVYLDDYHVRYEQRIRAVAAPVLTDLGKSTG